MNDFATRFVCARAVQTGARLTACALLLAGLAGCFNPFSPRIAPARGTSSPPPVPNSPAQVVELFAWCWNNRAYQEYTELFTEDFRFQFSYRDTAGSGGRADFLTREEELQTALHLFVEGSATEPAATSISLDLTRPLIADHDSRDGQNGLVKAEPWHYEITTNVTLRISAGDADYQVVGAARFFLVRGDSALIPDDLTGFPPDSTRWWIERWEDDTDSGNLAATIARIEAARGVPGAGAAAFRAAPGAARLRMAAPRAAAVPIDMTWARLKLGYLGRPASRAAP